MPRTQRDVFEQETEAAFRRAIEDGQRHTDRLFDEMKRELKQRLTPLYQELEGQTITRAHRARIRTIVADVVEDYDKPIKENVKQTSTAAAVIGFAGLIYETSRKNRIEVPVKPTELARINHDHVAKPLSDGLNYTMRLERNKRKMTAEITTRVGRGVTEGEGWIALESGVDKTFMKYTERTKMIQEVEGERIKEETTEESMHLMKRAGIITTKTWISQADDRVRDTHEALHGTTIEDSQYFETVNGRALAPHRFGVAEEDIRCRCYLVHDTKEIKDEDELREAFEGGGGSFDEWARQHGYEWI